jgi:hypothetical protein
MYEANLISLLCKVHRPPTSDVLESVKLGTTPSQRQTTYERGTRYSEAKQKVYEGPPVSKSPGVNKPPPVGPQGGPMEGGKRDQHFAEIVSALHTQFLRPCESVFVCFLRFSHREPRIGVRARVRGGGG